MNEKKRLKILIGALCAVLVFLVIGLALLLDSQSPDPVFGVFQTEPAAPGEATQNPTDPTGEASQETKKPDTTKDQPTEQAPSVVIPPKKDPQTGEELGISFPCQIPGYDMTIERIAPYDGMFVEDGSNADAQNVAMLLVKNDGDFPVEYAQIRVMCEQEELLFDISALPAGEQLVVQEKNGKTIAESKATSASALVVQRANMEMSEGKVQVSDNGDNTLTIKNLTNETIPTVRVFYKYYMENEDLFVGGIAFTARISRLGAGTSVTIQPSHYTSQSSRVVMVLTYDSEV